MIDATSGLGGAPSSLFTPPGGQLGKDEFLQLLVAQLKNQDPMNPMESQEFAAQLAQFSSVEQLMGVNEKLTGQAEYTAALAQAMNSSAAVGVLGRDVVAVGNGVGVAAGQAVLDVDVGGMGGSATVRLYDEQGNAVASVDLGSITGGRQSLPVDGLDLPDGAYRYEIEVTDPAGEAVSTTSFVTGTVSGIKYEMDGPVLMVGDLEIPLSAVLEVSAQ